MKFLVEHFLVFLSHILYLKKLNLFAFITTIYNCIFILELRKSGEMESVD